MSLLSRRPATGTTSNLSGLSELASSTGISYAIRALKTETVTNIAVVDKQGRQIETRILFKLHRHARVTAAHK
jgi:hypothetical protein